MGVTLFDEAVLSDIDSLQDIEDTQQVESSLEALDIPQAISTDSTVVNCPSALQPTPVASPPLLQYTINPLPSGSGKMVTFYLNIPDLSSKIINQFVMLIDILVTYQDVLFVHLNSILEIDDSHVIYNAIYSCNAKAKIACIPYALNTASLYPALACDFIIPTKFGLFKFDACSVMAGGIGHKDAKNAYEFDVGRKTHLLNIVNEAGFLPEEKLRHILDKQGSFILYGDPLKEAISQFNKRKRQVKVQNTQK